MQLSRGDHAACVFDERAGSWWNPEGMLHGLGFGGCPAGSVTAHVACVVSAGEHRHNNLLGEIPQLSPKVLRSPPETTAHMGGCRDSYAGRGQRENPFGTGSGGDKANRYPVAPPATFRLCTMRL